MTPVQIILLLKIFCGEELGVSDSASNSLIWAQSEGLMTKNLGTLSGYGLTPRGEALVQMLKDTPLPVQTWHDPRLTVGERR